MRTNTPEATCSTMTLRGESATEPAISKPRFIGPGCMTMVCAGNEAARAALSP